MVFVLVDLEADLKKVPSPAARQEDFAAGGVSFLARYELPRRQTEEEVAGNSTRCRMWTEEGGCLLLCQIFGGCQPFGS